MKLRKKIAYGLALTGIIAGLHGIAGCRDGCKDAPKPKYFASVPMYPKSGVASVAGDFDGDGKMDMVISSQTTSRRSEADLYLFKNDGYGRLVKPEGPFMSVPMHSVSGISIVAGDFDGNGTLDIVVTSQTTSRRSDADLYMFRNDGRGNFYQD